VGEQRGRGARHPDVSQYLRNPGVRDAIEEGVREALPRGAESVVVAHSLGTVVAYNLLRREAVAQDWQVPQLITLGSPLAVGPVRRALQPLKHPERVGGWFNAYDERDVVSLFPLDPGRFPVTPPVENYGEVDNDTSNRHGISGYLSDPVVARRIHAALVD
jgi:pimeloyl-ACP methyl ester carboxylesterase